MDELDRGREADMLVTVVTAQACAGQGQERPEPLAAGGDEMAGQLGDQRDVGLHMIDDDLVHPGEIGSAKVTQIVERVRRSF